MVHRKLSRTADHRHSLLRNLATSLIEYGSITTTLAKAKEAQTFAERLITRARNLQGRSPHERGQVLGTYVYKPKESLPRLEELAERYAGRTGGYTRILKLENRLGDNAPQAILELVGGPRDMRAAMTARVVARYEAQGAPLDHITQQNVDKLVKQDEEGFRALVAEMKEVFYSEAQLAELPPIVERQPRKRAPIELVNSA